MTDTHPDVRTPLTDAQRDGIRRSAQGTLIERMGIDIIELTAERTVATMPVEGNTQPAGLLHGGASAALAETVASYAAIAHAGTDRGVVGLDLNATHHRGVRSGTVTAVATALHLGRTLASYEITVSDDAGRRVCTARLTCMILTPR
ncbi:hotdog fold thioesterase [Sanguibacter sp. A247]|uniref:hotdog fold thioesterase n=1 Tax=unclassified Sanguibacter TaxID=2645534 RepID=UPI003FD765EC